MAACAAFDAMRAEVQLRTSVKVYREMPGLRATLFDAAATMPELAKELVDRVFARGEDDDEAAAASTRDAWPSDGSRSERVAPPPAVLDAMLFSESSESYSQAVRSVDEFARSLRDEWRADDVVDALGWLCPGTSFDEFRCVLYTGPHTTPLAW